MDLAISRNMDWMDCYLLFVLNKLKLERNAQQEERSIRNEWEQRKTHSSVMSQMQRWSCTWELSNLPEILWVGEPFWMAVPLLPSWQMSCTPGVLIRITMTSVTRKAFLINLSWSLMSVVCTGDSCTTSLFSTSVINPNDTYCTSDTIC